MEARALYAGRSHELGEDQEPQVQSEHRARETLREADGQQRRHSKPIRLGAVNKHIGVRPLVEARDLTSAAVRAAQIKAEYEQASKPIRLGRKRW